MYVIVDNLGPSFESLMLAEDELPEGAMVVAQRVIDGVSRMTPRQFNDYKVRSSLLDRLRELSDYTGVSMESLAVDTWPSMENAVIDFVKAVIGKILEWIKKVIDFIANLIRKMFGVKNVVRDKHTSTKRDVERAKKAHTEAAKGGGGTGSAKTDEKFENIELVLSTPAKFYIAMHSTKHLPQPGYAYNQKSIEANLTSIEKDITHISRVLGDYSKTLLGAIGVMVKHIKTGQSDLIVKEALRPVKASGTLWGMANHGHNLLGTQLSIVPVSAPNSHITDKVTINRHPSESQWLSAEGPEITVLAGSILTMSDTIARQAPKQIDALALILSEIISSKDIKELKSLLDMIIRGNIAVKDQVAVVRDINIAIELMDALKSIVVTYSKAYCQYASDMALLASLSAKALNI